MEKRANTSEVSLQVYGVYFSSFLAGILLNLLYPSSLFSDDTFRLLGAIFILLAPALLLWAFVASARFRRLHAQRGEVTHADLCRGPYYFLRHPAYFAVAVLLVGCGFLLSAPAVVACVSAAGVLTILAFRKKEEAYLEARYGNAYCEYKKRVRM